jgi:hypothetical protein
MKLAVTIDVEEEGLFRGTYETGNAPVENVSRLGLLHLIFSELEIHPTLFVSYQAARCERFRGFLLDLSEKWKGEIGAHLHYWNTPPIEPIPFADPVPSEWILRPLLSAKLDTLMESLRQMGVQPRSFRMGRFSMGSNLFSLLEEKGFMVDSSILPGREWDGGPSHLSAPIDPYFPDPKDVCAPGGSRILEAPLTIVPVLRSAAFLLQAFGKRSSQGAKRVGRFLQSLLTLPAQPAWVGLHRLKAAASIHRRRGGEVINIHMHSSELMPGGYPGHQTEEDVRRFLLKLKGFLGWLREEVGSEALTLSKIRGLHESEPHV